MKDFAPYAGWIGLASGLAALLLFFLAPQLVILTYSLFLVAILNGLFFFWIDRKVLINSVVLSGVVFGILVFVNFLAYKHKRQIDWTETGYHTLAEQTKNIVKALSRQVKLTAFFPTNEPGRVEFQRMIEGFKGLTDKIEVEFIDPDKDPLAAKRYEVNTYGTVVFESEKREARIKTPTEENITNALLKVTQDKQKTVYFLEGHGEKNIGLEDTKGYSKARKSLEKDNFKVESLLLLQTGSVPDDADLLVIAGPHKVLLPKELKAIESYLGQGGSVLMLLDPQTEPGLKNLLENWGVDIQKDLVVDPQSKMFGGDYAAPVISQYSPHGITKDFALPTIFPLLRSVKAITTEGLETTEVLFSGPRSWAETDYSSGTMSYDPKVDLKGPVPVSVAVTKTLPSLTSDKDGTQPPAATKKANLVVIGDSDFAANGYFDFSGNGDFFSNTASWLLQEENLISIRPRQRKNSPLALTAAQGSMTFAVGIILLPAFLILTGVSVWWRRRAL
jgi:ABC-type uncharacterized transport system involved in gliding motility auxiliary subunit